MSNGFYFNAPHDINLDINETSPEIKNTAKFIKNLSTAVNRNGDGNTPQKVGNNSFIRTPPLSNEIICDGIVLPAGDNYCIGSYYDTQSKETYARVWNSKGNHFIYRINENWECEIVYQGSCLGYNLSSENFIPQTRNELFYKCQTNLFTGESNYIRDLISVDGLNWQQFISVNDSIATKSFTWDENGLTDKFRYSNPLDKNNSVLFDPCEYIQLIPRMPMRCIGIEELPNADTTKNNFLINKSWQFRVKFYDVWNRESEHGVISNLYIPVTNGCQGASSALPRCLQLQIEAGSPIVAKIAIEFRNCISTNTDIPIDSDWYTYDVIERYADCGANNGKDWFNRVVTLPGYNATTNTFLYEFCADKECTPIPVDQTNRTSNPMPITSGALTRVGNGIVLANNQVGYPAVNCETKDLLNVEYEAPVAECKPKFCDIEFWAVIHNPFTNNNQFVYNVGGTQENYGFTGGAWKWGGVGKFTAATGTTPTISGTDTDYGQRFDKQTNNQQNFYAYLEGTEFKVQAFQQRFDGATLFENGGVAINSTSGFNGPSRDIKNGSYYLQHFVFRNIPLGKYLIRIPGHNNTQDGNYQDTSTYVVGTIDKSNYLSWNTDWTDVDTYYKELEINTCDESPGSLFSTTTMLMICDLTCPDNAFLSINSRSNAWYGYLKDSLNQPVELSPLIIKDIDSGVIPAGFSIVPDPSLAPQSWDDLINKTDHNGFWFCAFSHQFLVNVSVTMEYTVESGACPVEATTSIEFDDNANTDIGSAAEIPVTVSEVTIPNYALCKSILITGRVTDCNNRPIAGLPMCFTRSKSSKTNSNGYFNIIIHNDIDIDFVTLLGRQLGSAADDDRIFLSQNGLCVFVNCDTCITCVDVLYNVDINDDLQCFSCVGDDKKQLTIYTTKVRFPGIDQKGLKHGSTNKFGLKLFDAAGRHTFVGTDDSLSLYIPKAQQQLSQQFGRVKYTLSNTIFPSWVEYVGIYWTDQNAAYKFLEFVISSKDINIQSGKITLGFQSVVNYYTDNNFDTNTSWEFLKGDRIEFIADENGNFFDANDPQIGILNFQIEGNITNTSGVIDYDKRLDNIQIGTLVQLQRPKECNNELFYWEVCAPIQLIGGQIPTDKLTGYLEIWNAYIVSRRIRYAQGGIDSIHFFPFSFEHFAPSDTWGGNCGNRGRVNTVNHYEQQYCRPMDVALSDSYSTNINGLSRFDDANTHQFDDNGYGSITAMVTKLNYVLFICTNSSFVVVYDDNTLRTNSEGRLVYTGAKFSKPNPQNRELGCRNVDVSTIVLCDGLVKFLDVNNKAWAAHDFVKTWDDSEESNYSKGGFYGYLSSKIDTVQEYNAGIVGGSKIYEKIFVGAFDPEKSEALLTQFNLPLYYPNGDKIDQNAIATYNNTEVDVNETVPETIAFNIYSKSLKTFYGFTQEYYSILNNQLISFKGAVAYNHGISNTLSYNNFNGVDDISVFDFVCNADSPDLVKLFQWIELYRTNKKFYASMIVTENGQLSQIPLDSFEEVDNFLTSQFLCDINSYADPNIPELATATGRLFNGDMLRGKWLRCKLISDSTNPNDYFEFQAATIFVSPIQKSGSQGNPS